MTVRLFGLAASSSKALLLHFFAVVEQSSSLVLNTTGLNQDSCASGVDMD